MMLMLRYFPESNNNINNCNIYTKTWQKIIFVCFGIYVKSWEILQTEAGSVGFFFSFKAKKILFMYYISMQVNFNIINLNNYKYKNTVARSCNTYSNLAPLKTDVVSFSGKKDLMKYPAEEIINIALCAIREGVKIGEGREAVTYKIENFPEYCVRRERKFKESHPKLSMVLDKFDIENHVVARLDEGTTIMRYIPGVPIKITNSYGTINDIKRDIHELIADSFDILPFKKVLVQIEDAKSKGIQFDRLGENLLVDPMNHEMTCIDFSPKIKDDMGTYNPISYIYSALDVGEGNSANARRIFGKLCCAYAERVLETPVSKLNLGVLDMHFYDRYGFPNDPFNGFPEPEILRETEKKLQDILRLKQNPSHDEGELKKMISEFTEYIDTRVMSIYDDYYGSGGWY